MENKTPQEEQENQKEKGVNETTQSAANEDQFKPEQPSKSDKPGQTDQPNQPDQQSEQPQPLTLEERLKEPLRALTEGVENPVGELPPLVVDSTTGKTAAGYGHIPVDVYVSELEALKQEYERSGHKERIEELKKLKEQGELSEEEEAELERLLAMQDPVPVVLLLERGQCLPWFLAVSKRERFFIDVAEAG